MNYLVTTLILFIIIYLLLFLNSKKENFEDIDSSQCIDQETNQVRGTSNDEQKQLEKEIEKKKDDKEKSKNQAKEQALKDKKEVFLIYNKYSYLEAKELCKSYSGRLATEKDLIKAFKNGANWCSWGWLEGEKIAYPVQENYWTKIEKTHKGFCGPTAGINKIENIDPFKRFSVTCYGIKPKKTDNDKDLSQDLNEMSTVDPLAQAIQKCKKEKQVEEQKKWIENQKKDISILGFNKEKWSILDL